MFDSVTLEMSLKPFKKTDDRYIRKVCAALFEQWRPLLKNRKTVSVMLWTADGSELLDYDGDPESTFEWCRFIGTAALDLLHEGEAPDTSLHTRKRDYMPNAPKMTYKILKNIIAALKEEGAKALPDCVIRVGETVDIGPEFAISDFKYNRHKEICSGHKLDHFGFVDATATLNSDNRRYAAYPDGIPAGTCFGTFLGAQANRFLDDMGFDFLWLSNGLGFSADPWLSYGKIFDGKEFHPEKLGNVKAKVFDFWKKFREACPDIPLETRGTNQSVGIDYATDGVPLYDIYNSGLNIMPPPNSPWAALNYDYGLEIMGHMTRICNLPGRDYTFRYYIHDPWWCNSPWYDRYEGYPTDIYMPMAISRIDENGGVQSATVCNILSVDNSFGDMPDSCVNEPLPHLLKAEKDAPDEISPLVWVYPMREYTTSENETDLAEMYYGDKYICGAVNEGLPLCTVVSTDNFIKNNLSFYKSRILISPVLRGEALKKLTEFSENGGAVIIYGSKSALESIPDGASFIKADIAESPALIRKALSRFGYGISFEKKESTVKTPVTAIHKNNGAFYFSVYNPNITTDTLLSLPLGAPIMLGLDAEVSGDTARYRFSRIEHRECRIFVKQKNGIVTAAETAPVSAKWRRRIMLKGLDDAEVYFLPESYCTTGCKVCKNAVGDPTPDYDDSFKSVYDEKTGLTCYTAKHITGHRSFLMPFPEK